MWSETRGLVGGGRQDEEAADANVAAASSQLQLAG